MSDHLCQGWKQIAQVLTDGEGIQMYSAEAMRQRFKDEMREAGVTFRMSRGHRNERTCAWASKVRMFFELRGRE